MAEIDFRISPPVTSEELNELFDDSWPSHVARDMAPVLKRSLLYVCSYSNRRLSGFVNVAWDGGVYAFVLDTTVHPELRRMGVGVELVRRAASTAKGRGVEWLHVDFVPQLRDFCAQCGFVPTEAGVIHLKPADLPAA